MPGNSTQRTAGAPQPIVVVALTVVLFLFIGLLAYRYLGPQRPEINTKPTSPTDQWIFAKAKETHGDISKLSPEDRAKLQSLTRGMGEAALKGAWQNSQ